MGVVDGIVDSKSSRGGEERGRRAREEKLRRGDGVADGTEMLGLAADQGNREKRKLGDVVSSWPVEIGEGVEAPRSRKVRNGNAGRGK